jgi:hypothetical protein
MNNLGRPKDMITLVVHGYQPYQAILQEDIAMAAMYAITKPQAQQLSAPAWLASC